MAAMTDDQRAHALAALPEELVPWRSFLMALFNITPDHEREHVEPDASVLLAHAEANGLRRGEAKQLIAALLDSETLRGHWSNWTQTVDRDELRLRLEILSHSDAWTEDFAPFVTFFFRASVADLYQHAAIALGRHLHRSTKLREYLASYSTQRSVPMDRSVALAGARSARRMIIAMAAARANLPDEPAITREPIPIERSEDGRPRIALPPHPADLATVLLALDVMVAAEPNDEELIGLTRDVLGRVSRMEAASLSRAAVLRFGALLTRCGGDETEANWSRLFIMLQDELRGLGDGRFGRRVAGLFQLDELLRCASVLADAPASAVAQRIAQWPNAMERRFIAARTLTWAQREHRSLPRWTEPLQHLTEDADGTLRELGSSRLSPGAMLARMERTIRVKARRPEPLFAEGASDADLALLDQLLHEIERPATWLSHEEPERALLAMVMIDLAQHTHPPAEQMAALLERHGFSRTTDAQSAARSSGSATTGIILRLLTWEKPGAEDLIDVRMLHRIDDLRVLLALIPTGRRSPLLPILADAIEHQLRWRLRRDETFSPDVLLALTQVRQPHPQLYHALRALCEGRTYRRVGGNAVELLPLINYVCDETERAADVAPSAAPPLDSPYARSLIRVRDRLREAGQSHDDLRQRIETMLDAIGEVTAARTARSGTVIGVLQLLHEPDRPLLQDGYPAWTDLSLSAFLRDIEADLIRMKTLAHALLPEQWRSGDDVREAVSGLRTLLDRRLNELARMMPAAEADSLRRLRGELDGELVAWGETVESIINRWPEQAMRLDTGGMNRAAVNFAAANEAIAAIGRLEHPLLRGHLLGLLWQSLRSWSTPRGGDDFDAWAIQRQLLDEAIAHPLVSGALVDAGESSSRWSDADRRRAHGACIAAWIDLAAQAMERNEEHRVIELATEARYEPLRQQPAAAETLRAIRKWCHDRYLLRPAASVQNDLRSADQASPRGLWREVLPFLANFPTVWLAMLIGAIFMLDFGDAWAAMAEPDVADIRGITITFLIGIGGAFGYILWNLSQKSRLAPGESAAAMRRSQLVRAGAFSAVCLIYTLLLVSGLWWLLSETDEVVEGVWAIGHIIVWSGFALFVGVFFGLLAGDA